MALLEDQEANLWVSTDDGLFRLRRRVIQSFTQRDGLPGDETWSLSPARHGGVWVGTQRGGVCRIVADRVESLPPLDVAREFVPTVQAVLEDSRGRVFATASHGAGVFEFADGAWRSWPGTAPLADALYEDRQGRVWFGGAQGARWHQGERLHRWSRTNGLPDAIVRVIHQSRDLAMWFGTGRGGLARLEEKTGEVRVFGPAEGLASDEIWALHEAPDGALWIGGNRGLARFGMRDSERGMRNQPAAIVSFTPAHGLPNDVVNWILEDGQGQLWLSGLRGLHRVARAELEAVARGERRTASCATYGVADGMETAETNGKHAPAGCVDAEGRLWFPTGKGVVRIDPRLVNVSEQPPVVVIEEVKADGEEVTGCRLQVAGSAGASAHLQPATCDLQLPPAGRGRCSSATPHLHL